MACWAASLRVSARGPPAELAVVAQVQPDEHEHLVQAVLTQRAQARLRDIAHRCHRLGDEPNDAVRSAVPGLPGEQGLPEPVALGDPGAGVGDAEGRQQRADLAAGQPGVGRAEDVGNALDDVAVPDREALDDVEPEVLGLGALGPACRGGRTWLDDALAAPSPVVRVLVRVMAGLGAEEPFAVAAQEERETGKVGAQSAMS